MTSNAILGLGKAALRIRPASLLTAMLDHSLSEAQLDKLILTIKSKEEACFERGDYDFARGLRDAIAEIENACAVSFRKKCARKGISLTAAH